MHCGGGGLNHLQDNLESKRNAHAQIHSRLCLAQLTKDYLHLRSLREMGWRQARSGCKQLMAIPKKES